MLVETNEAIHRVAGQVRALADPGEAWTASRADTIAEVLALLPASSLHRLRTVTPHASHSDDPRS